MFNIRPMAPYDIPAILRLDSEIPETPHWGRSVYQGYLGWENPARRLFVAERDERLYGYIAGRIIVDVCELESIAVATSARRSGVGSALLSALIGWARYRCASHVQLEVRAGNTSAIAFYRSAGFHTDGIRPAYYSNPDEDALLMTLLLEPEPEP